VLKILSKLRKRNPYLTLRIFSAEYQQYLKDCAQWKAQGGIIDVYRPIVDEKYDNAGMAKGHYFHQDLLVASFVQQKKPKRHIDIGSRIDGFVAHVASFRKIEVFDIRHLPKSPHENIMFRKVDFMTSNEMSESDSVSCLHTLEHFGLGRYGDPISVAGFDKGVQNLISLVSKGGMLYISFPIGVKSSVQFNAHRILHPAYLLQLEPISKNMVLERFDFVDDNGDLHLNANMCQVPNDLSYGCGIYSLKRV